MSRLLSLALLAAAAVSSAAVVVVAPSGVGGGFPGGIQFVSNGANDYDHTIHTALPASWGNGEFTLKIAIDPDETAPVGVWSTAEERRAWWTSETDTPYSSSNWWFAGNFLLDGHNNSNFANGTLSVQIHNGGHVRFLFGDGSGTIPTGGLWSVQDDSSVNILDSSVHVIHAGRRFINSSDSELFLYVDGTLIGTEVSDVRTAMFDAYWTGDNWSGFPSSPDERGWFWGAEKQAANDELDYEDFKGVVLELTFYDDDLSGAEIASDQGAADPGHPDYADHWALTEGSGLSATSNGGLVMDFFNAQPGGFWP